MRKLAVLLIMAASVLWTGCGDSSTSALPLVYVARGDSEVASVFTFNPVSKVSTPVNINFNTNSVAAGTWAQFVSATLDASAVTYCYNTESDTYDIYMMGTDNVEHQLTTGADACESQFSPDGKTIAYVSEPEESDAFQIFTMNSDGTGQTPLFTDTTGTTDQWLPQFSHDGKSIVFFVSELEDVAGAAKHQFRHNSRSKQTWPQVSGRNHAAHRNGEAVPPGWYVMALNGTSPTLVYQTSESWGSASFTSDDSGVLLTVFDGTEWNIATVKTDGTGFTPLTTNTSEPDFAAVTYKNLIVFNTLNDTNESADIWVMNQDGSNQALAGTSPVDTWESLADSFWEED